MSTKTVGPQGQGIESGDQAAFRVAINAPSNAEAAAMIDNAAVINAIEEDQAAVRDASGVDALPWKRSDCIAAWHYEHTTQAGGKVTEWEDLSGNGHTLSQAATAKQGVVYDDGVEVFGYGYSVGGAMSISGRSYTALVFFRPPATLLQLYGMFFHCDSSGPGVSFDGGHSYLYGPNSRTGAAPTYAPDQITSYAIVGNSTDVITYADGCERRSGAAHTDADFDLSYFLSSNTGSLGMRGKIIGAVFFSSALSKPEIHRVAAFFGAANSGFGKRKIHYLGDSIALGSSASSHQKTLAYLSASATGSTYNSRAQSGLTMSSLAGYTSGYFLPTPGTQNIYVLHAGTNDLASASGQLATLQGNFQTICAAIRAGDPYGKIIACTVIARDATFIGGQNSAGFETDKDDYNTWLRSNFATYSDGLADFALNAVFDTTADTSNTTYYNADKIHPNDVGHLELAKILVAAIRNL